MTEASGDGPHHDENDLEARAKKVSEKLSAAESERDQALERVGSVERERDQFEAGLEAAQRRCESAEGQVEELQRQVADAERQTETETAARIEAETERDQFAEQVAAEEAAHARTTRALKELQAEHEVVVEANDQLTQQLDDETTAHAKTRAERDTAQEQAANRGTAAVVLGATTVASLIGHAVRE